MAVKAKLLGGSSAKDVPLDASVFEAELRPHLVHETVRAEQNAARAGTRGDEERVGCVAGGRAKPWRQKGTGRARQGTTRAPQFTGGGVAFPPGMRSFEVKVNRKARRAALSAVRSSHHVASGTLALVDGGSFAEPSTKQAAELLASLGQRPAAPRRRARGRGGAGRSPSATCRGCSSRCPAELGVAAVVWARSVLVSEAALPLVEAKAGQRHEGGRMSLHPGEILLAPVVSEKSYSGLRRPQVHVQGAPGRPQDAGAPGGGDPLRRQGRARQHHQGAAEAEAARSVQAARGPAGRRPSCSCARATPSTSSRGHRSRSWPPGSSSLRARAAAA